MEESPDPREPGMDGSLCPESWPKPFKRRRVNAAANHELLISMLTRLSHFKLCGVTWVVVGAGCARKT